MLSNHKVASGGHNRLILMRNMVDLHWWNLCDAQNIGTVANIGGTQKGASGQLSQMYVGALWFVF